ncbi:hypothetical protein EO087_00230 [Dyella sp. M7H15-1]|uniref:hypothetical protein n=1 Tax=Dyella sp. M7H15-1 TaxID=2501295 RepID=UPI001004FEC6|nr:hypothetical protein [Dyella sp. M7H15-1]QAU22592.1 hypothetical protein EO087_00230 [Dyella sp. M7H15-1]
MTLLPLIVTQPFGDYKHGDRIDDEAAVMDALEHHPHFVVQVPGDVKSPAKAKTTDARAGDAKLAAK